MWGYWFAGFQASVHVRVHPIDTPTKAEERYAAAVSAGAPAKTADELVEESIA